VHEVSNNPTLGAFFKIDAEIDSLLGKGRRCKNDQCEGKMSQLAAKGRKSLVFKHYSFQEVV